MRVPVSLRAQHVLDALAHRAAAAAAALTQCTAAADFSAPHRPGAGEARRAGARGGPAGRHPCSPLRRRRARWSARICSYPASLLVDALRHDRDPELRRALGRRRRRARRQQPDLDAGPQRPHDRGAVADVELLRFGAVGVHDDACRRSARRPRRAGRGGRVRRCLEIWVLTTRTSACATGRAGARRLRPAAGSSTTTTDVILWVSMIRSASTASISRRIVRGFGVIDVAGGQRQHVGGRDHQAAQVAVGEDARPAGRRRRRRRSCRGACRHLVDDVGHRGRRCGRSARRRPECITFSTRISLRPSLPPGWSDANCSSRNPLRTSSVIASASPSASAAVVLAVGTRFIGHASSAMPQSSVTSAARAERRVGSTGDGDQPARRSAGSIRAAGPAPRSRRCATAPAPRRLPGWRRDRRGSLRRGAGRRRRCRCSRASPRSSGR